MPGVARLGDALTHGATITSASPMHMVNNKGVARVGDSVSCPTHGSQTIVSVQTEVKTDGRLVAHIGAMASCGAVITQGSGDTFVSNTVDTVSVFQEVPGETGAEVIQYEEKELKRVSAEDESSGGITPAEVGDPNAPVPPSDSNDTPPPEMQPVTKDCNDIPPNPPDSFLLSPHFTIANMSTQASASPTKISAQNGLSESQIICNLKTLCENSLEPIAAHFGRGSFRIGSGFRRMGKNANSQHLLGQAADLHFFEPGTTTRVSHARLLEIATWIKDNVPYYQLLLEFYGSPYGWVHLGLRPNTSARHPTKPVASGFNGSGGLKSGLHIP